MQIHVEFSVLYLSFLVENMVLSFWLGSDPEDVKSSVRLILC